MSHVFASVLTRRNVRLQRTASGVRAWVEKSREKHSSEGFSGSAKTVCRTENHESVCDHATEMACPSLPFHIQSP
jgi:hypothetical protein